MKKSKAYIIVDLGFGDSGKGTITDYLSQLTDANTIVRYTGGPQAGHHVVATNGFDHVFYHVGSSSRFDIKSHLAEFMLIKPPNIVKEAEVLQSKGNIDCLSRLSIDPNCQIITPYHAMIRQMQEVALGSDYLGTSGIGLGQAIFDKEKYGDKVLFLKDLYHLPVLKKKLIWHRTEKIQQAQNLLKSSSNPEVREIFLAFIDEVTVTWLIDEYQQYLSLAIKVEEDEKVLSRIIKSSHTIILEGSHGSLIDRQFGFWPYVTKTRTTAVNAHEFLGYCQSDLNPIVIGILRAHSYRYGPGPLVTFQDDLATVFLETHHSEPTPWQGKTRQGWFDLLMIRYGIAINPTINTLALTMVDKIAALNHFKVCTSYQYVGKESSEILNQYFIWHKSKSGIIRITDLKPAINNQSDLFAKLLMDCRPLEYLDFYGPAITNIPSLSDSLPAHVQQFIEFLESDQGLSKPVSIISYGPTAREKIIRNLDI